MAQSTRKNPAAPHAPMFSCSKNPANPQLDISWFALPEFFPIRETSQS
jgi:hypothetical protein